VLQTIYIRMLYVLEINMHFRNVLIIVIATKGVGTYFHISDVTRRMICSGSSTSL